MAALFLVLAVVAAVVVGDAAIANTSAGSVSVFNHAITGFTQGQLLVFAAGLGLLVALFVGLARSWSSGQRAKRRARRAARRDFRDFEGRIADLERENKNLRRELERPGRSGQPVGLRQAVTTRKRASQPEVNAHA